NNIIIKIDNYFKEIINRINNVNEGGIIKEKYYYPVIEDNKDKADKNILHITEKEYFYNNLSSDSIIKGYNPNKNNINIISNSFNVLLDIFYSYRTVKAVKKDKTQNIVDKQKLRVNTLIKNIEEMRKVTDIMEYNKYEIESFLNHVIDLMKVDWQYSIDFIKSYNGNMVIKKYKLEKKIINVNIEGMDIELKLEGKNIFYSNLTKYYDSIKKKTDKLNKTKKYIEGICNNENNIKKGKKKDIRIPLKGTKAKHNINWYEKFYWYKIYHKNKEIIFIAGRNREQNDRIVNYYLKEKYLYFHSEVQGSSVVCIYGDNNNTNEIIENINTNTIRSNELKNHNNDKIINDNTKHTDEINLYERLILIGGQMALVFSGAWKSKRLVSSNVVLGEQVSRSKESGESGRGYILRGKRRNVGILSLEYGITLVKVYKENKNDSNEKDYYFLPMSLPWFEIKNNNSNSNEEPNIPINHFRIRLVCGTTKRSILISQILDLFYKQCKTDTEKIKVREIDEQMVNNVLMSDTRIGKE
ncbi:hypothetical protein SLOPH_1738, partial [Spraguea lophii 42_110]